MLRFAIKGIVTKYELDKLTGLSGDDPFICHYSDELIAELRRLRAMALVTNHEGVGIADIVRQFKNTPHTFDLKRFFRITDYGQEYLELREQATFPEDG